MSYSFAVNAANKAEAVQKVGEKLDEIVGQQPVHEHDKAAALAASEAFINALLDPVEGEAVHVSVSGSLGWRAEGEYTHANFAVYASITAAGG